MFKKVSVLMLGLPLIGAIGGPLAYFKLLDHGKPAAATAADAASGTTPPPAYLGSSLSNSPGASGALAAVPLAIGEKGPRSGVLVQDASSVFNFDITPEWILARWPGVSTGLALLELEGYRVPLVTGTAQQDLAGSLTYYFDAKQKLQRITFIGVSGDPRPIVGLLTYRFHMTRRLTNDPGLVVYEGVESSNRIASVIHVRLAPAIEAGDSFRRYNIELSLERPEE